MMLTVPEVVLIVIITLLVVGLNKLQAIGKAIARLQTEYSTDADANSSSDNSK